jgi:antitoxin HigA-1
MAKLNKRCPAHPGRLVREYMGDKLTATDLAAHLRITRTNLSRLINGHGGVSAGLALRLSEALGTTPELWLNMQVNYDRGYPSATR